ncbi:hypothetical protein [Actinophytocola sp. NPDC049390]|uniref:hypothetical protein n=1 Tax=Actinophytocola sp. NPDC049390 TaxID=3363894 RepID=UPI0037B1F9E0
MQPQHPDYRFPLTQHERDQFDRICQELANGEPEQPGTGAREPVRVHPGWAAAAIACMIFVFVGLAVNSVLLVAVAAAGAAGPYLARRLPRGSGPVARRDRDRGGRR